MKFKASKFLRSCIAAALAICLTAPIFSPIAAVAAGASTVPSLNYLAIGSGVSYEGDSEYPELVSGGLDADSVSIQTLGVPGMRIEELHLLLDDYYGGDSYTEKIFGSMSEEDLWALKQEYRDAVKKADVITLDIGEASFSDYAVAHVFEGKYDADYSVFEENISYGIAEIKSRFFEVFSSYVSDAEGVDITSIVDGMLDAIFYSLVGYCANLDEAVKHIYELNPDAQIVVMSVQNPLYNLEATVPGMNLNMPLGIVYGIVVDMANAYASGLCRYNDDYYYSYLGEGAVSTHLNDIKAYNGDPATVSEEIKAACDAAFGLDALAKAASLSYDAAYASLLDTVLTVLKLASTPNVVDIASAMEYAENKVIVDEMISGWLKAAAQDSSFAVESTFEFRALATNKALLSALLFGIRCDIAGGVLTEPNAAGHRTLADSVLSAIKNGIHGEDALNEKMNVIYPTLLEFIGDDADVDVEASLKPYFVKDRDSVYIALGDVSTSPANSYANKLAKEWGFTGDKYLNLADTNMNVESAIQYVKNNYKTIRKADIITVSFTNIDASRALMNGITGKGSDCNWAKYLGTETAAMLEGALKDIRTMLIKEGIDASMAKMILSAVEGYAYSYASRLLGYPELLDEIRRVAPNALIVVVGTYNELAGAVIEMEGTEIAIGDYVQYLVDLANLETLFEACIGENIAYVASPEVEIERGAFKKSDVISFASGYLMASLDILKLAPSEKSQNDIANEVKNTLTIVAPHDCAYDNGCDKKCNICMAKRSTPGHVYDNACDTSCNECGKTRPEVAHKYVGACDADCDECGAKRTADPHTFGEWEKLDDKTEKRVCTGCALAETRPAEAAKEGSNVVLVVAISVGAVAALAGGGFGVLTVVAKKKGLKSALALFKKS